MTPCKLMKVGTGDRIHTEVGLQQTEEAYPGGRWRASHCSKSFQEQEEAEEVVSNRCS